MIQENLLKLLPKLFNDAGIHNISIQARTYERGSIIWEYDIVINQNLSHSQILTLGKILGKFAEIEMRCTDDGMKIISTGAKPTKEA